ncbi:MAG: methyltransferase domain-containing protein [Candidatus Heimdallarchaeota archaeon]
MSLLYMKILEKDPNTFDEEFRRLFPESKEIYRRILESIGKGGKVLEIGCGTGQLSRMLAQKGLDVTAVDISEEMIDHATEKSQEEGLQGKIFFLQGDFINYSIFKKLASMGPFEYVVSTFVLSELTPLRQQLFLKQVKELLIPSGTLYIAAETLPHFGFKRPFYWFKRWIFSQIMVFRKTYQTFPIKNLCKLLKNYFAPTHLLSMGSIQLFGCTLDITMEEHGPVKLEPLSKTLGKFGLIRTLYCIINGIYTRNKVTPGIYSLGTPTKDSPLLVTGNYYWTVWRVNRSLIKSCINCWILIIDSAGINVWCAAGGKHFTHHQVIDALRLFTDSTFLNHKRLILPQLSATGVDQHAIRRYGWRPAFGPVYIDDFPEYERNDYRKAKDQAIVRFNMRFRILMAIQHTFFILVTVFLPLLLGLGFFWSFGGDPLHFWWDVAIQLAAFTILPSFVFPIIYPILRSVKSFFYKGVIFSSINSLLIFLWLSDKNLPTIIFWCSLGFLISFFVVLDFAGSTPHSNHLNVESDLAILMIPTIIIIIIVFVLGLFFPPIHQLF